MTRAEHLEWCKKRALAYCDRGNTISALASMFADLAKHPETAGHPGVDIGLRLMMIGALKNPAEVRHFIEGFN